mmetsp:Transcript_14363/g.25833  ORF Transcript_14363/g.25833 Transcript_14363/m.25833 type:complete len:257 (-) Transcript_14363:46-816(-)
MRLDKDESSVLGETWCPPARNGDVSDLAGLKQTVSTVDILQQIKQTLLTTLEVNLRVKSPVHNSLLRNASLNHGGSKIVCSKVSAQPVKPLRHSLEGTGAGMHSIVSGVGFSREPKLFVFEVNVVANRPGSGGGGGGGPEDLAAEVFPGKVFGRPFDGHVVDGFAGGSVCFSHFHVESVDDKHRLLISRRDVSVLGEHSKPDASRDNSARGDRNFLIVDPLEHGECIPCCLSEHCCKIKSSFFNTKEAEGLLFFRA